MNQTIEVCRRGEIISCRYSSYIRKLGFGICSCVSSVVSNQLSKPVYYVSSSSLIMNRWCQQNLIITVAWIIHSWTDYLFECKAHKIRTTTVNLLDKHQGHRCLQSSLHTSESDPPPIGVGRSLLVVTKTPQDPHQAHPIVFVQ